MARKYDHRYKVQAVKLAKEIVITKATKELRIPYGTIHIWLKAVKAGKSDIGKGFHTLHNEETNFWRKPALFSPPVVESQQKPENDISGFKNRVRKNYRENFILLPDTWYQPTRLL